MQALSEVEPLRQAQRKMVRALGLLERTAIIDLTLAQGHTLIEVDAAGRLNIGELAERLEVDFSVASRAAAGLVKLGYLASKSCPADRRAKELTITFAGSQALDRLNESAVKQATSALSLVSEDDRNRILAGVRLYADALEKLRRNQRLTVRVAEPRDNPQLAEIVKKVMTEFHCVGEGFSINDPEVDDMCGGYSQPRHRLLVVADGSKVFGVGGVGPLWGADPKICEVRKMYFSDEVRGFGFGRKLLEELLRFARGSGFTYCYLESVKEMVGAQKLYRSLGFEYLDAPIEGTGHFSCDVWMGRPLT